MYLTIDIGGTKTFIALFDARGRIVRSDKFLTDHNLDAFMNNFFTHLDSFSDVMPKSVIVAVAGIVKNNCPTTFGNLPWKKPPLEKVIKNLFNCPILFINDADAATLFESKFYSGKSIYLTFSTGIGGGIAMVEKSPHQTPPSSPLFPASPLASAPLQISVGKSLIRLDPASPTFEPGHEKYNFNGETLEWEDFAAASAIRKAYDDRDVTSLRSKSTSFDIASRLSYGLIDVISEHRPDVVIFGGPLAKTFRRWRLPLKIILKDRLPKNTKLPKLRRAKRPDLCVSYGAYLLGKEVEHA